MFTMKHERSHSSQGRTAQIREEMRYSSFCLIPDELKLLVLSYLQPRDICHLAQTNSIFRELVKDDTLWFTLSSRHFQVMPESRQFLCSYTWREYFAMKWAFTQPGAMKWAVPNVGGLPEERSRHTGSAVGNWIVIMGGSARDGSAFGDLCFFTPGTMKFRKKFARNMPRSIARHAACVIEDSIWIFGGSITTDSHPHKFKTNYLWVFRPATMEWEQICEEAVSGPIPSARSDHSMVAIGKKLYLFGGSDVSVNPNGDFFEFDTDTYTWVNLKTISKGSPPSPRSGHSMEAIGQRIFIFGGARWSGEEWCNQSNELFVYDTISHEWSQPTTEGPQPNVSIFATIFKVGVFLWIIGGGSIHSPVVLKETRILDTVNWRWMAAKKRAKDLTLREILDELKLRNLPTRGNLLENLEKVMEIENQHCLDIAGPSIPALCGLVAAVWGHQVFLFGGFCGGPVNDLRLIEMKWMKRLEACNIVVK